MENEFYPFVNLPLPYAYDALEPFIDAKTMMLHHDRHLQTYIDNLNNALKDRPGLQELSLEQLICNASRLQDDVQRTIRNNAGGVYNHRFYFDLLTNPAKREPQGGLRRAINSRFGGFSEFREAFTKAALSVFGSGYAWLLPSSQRPIRTTLWKLGCVPSSPLTFGSTPTISNITMSAPTT